MKLSKKVNYKKSKRNNIKKNKRVSNKKPKINKKPKVNRTKKARVKRGGNQFNTSKCVSQVMVRKELKRNMDDSSGEYAYSTETHQVVKKKKSSNLEVGEVSVHEPKFYVRCGLQNPEETEEETEMTLEEFANFIVDMLNKKITSVVSEIDLKQLNIDFEQGDDETKIKEKIRALITDLIEQGVFEKILQEFNKFQDVANLHKIGAEIAVFLRKNREDLIERLTEDFYERLTEETLNENNERRRQLTEEALVKLEGTIKGILEKEPFFTLSMNNNNKGLSVRQLTSIFNKQTGGEPVSIAIVTFVGAIILYNLFKKKKKSGNPLF